MHLVYTSSYTLVSHNMFIPGLASYSLYNCVASYLYMTVTFYYRLPLKLVIY